MNKSIIISNPNLEQTKTNFKKAGAKSIHILADFDKTLTTAFVDGRKVPSLISVLRDNNFLTPDYPAKAQALYNKYAPIEINPKISTAEKKIAMHTWWSEHFNLLIKSKLNKKDIAKAVEMKKIKLRDGVFEFVDLLNQENIPLIIMSSNGLGDESIKYYLKQQDKLFKNIYIISNQYIWDENGFAVDVKTPIIHGMNKDETMLFDYPKIYQEVENKKNVILLGDSPSDVGMIEGFEYDNLIKIGFLNENNEEQLEEFKKVFDIILLNDAGFEEVNKLLKEIV
jgi:5'-nucleotidase